MDGVEQLLGRVPLCLEEPRDLLSPARRSSDIDICVVTLEGPRAGARAPYPNRRTAQEPQPNPGRIGSVDKADRLGADLLRNRHGLLLFHRAECSRATRTRMARINRPTHSLRPGESIGPSPRWKCAAEGASPSPLHLSTCSGRNATSCV